MAVVGSRDLGECACAAQAKHWPPTSDERAHQEECPKAIAWILMLRIVGRWATMDGIEGFVSGGAKGADTLARDAASMNGFTVENKKFLEYKPAGGDTPFWQRAKERNQKIVNKADAVVAVFAPGPPSPGTSDTIQKAKTKGIPVYIWHNGRWTS